MIEIERDTATRRVIRSLARMQQNLVLPVQLPDGSKPVVIALPHDSLSEIESKVAHYGSASVIVAYSDHMSIIAFEKTTGELFSTSASGATVHGDSDIDMLIHLLREQQSSNLAISITKQPLPQTVRPVQELQYSF